MWSMILLMSRLPGGRSMSAGRRSEKLGYQQSTVCWSSIPPDNLNILVFYTNQRQQIPRGSPPKGASNTGY